AFGGFQHRAPAGVPAVVADDVGGERVDGDDLGDDVEIAAGVQLRVDVSKRLQSWGEFAARVTNTLGHRTDQPGIAGHQGCAPVGSADLVLPHHHSPVSI